MKEIPENELFPFEMDPDPIQFFTTTNLDTNELPIDTNANSENTSGHIKFETADVSNLKPTEHSTKLPSTETDLVTQFVSDVKNIDNLSAIQEKELLTDCNEESQVINHVILPRPPDGGWGWMVVLGSFMCNVIVDGIIFSYGLFLPELTKDLQASKGRLAWVGSLLAGFYLMAGPIVSGLANTYGCRPVTMVGTIISAASFAIASFAPNVELLCLTFGVCGGIGFGFIYLPAVVTVGYYFERRRAFATGLAVCGSGVGTFVMAPLVQYLLLRFEWRGTMLILAGIVLNCALFGALFRPLVHSVSNGEDVEKIQKPNIMQKIKTFRDAQKDSWQSIDELSSFPQVSMSLPEISIAMKQHYSLSPSGDDNSPPPSYNDVIGADMQESFAFLTTISPTPNMHKMKSPTCADFNKQYPNHKKAQHRIRNDMMRPFYRQDILYSASLLHLPEFEKSNNDLSLYAASVTKLPPIDLDNDKSCFSPAMRHTFRQMLDTSLLKSPTFLLLGASGFLTLAGFFVPFMFVVDRAIQEGISMEEATYILPVIGLTNTIGRVFCGWISDRPSLNALTINNGALVVGGLITIVSASFHSMGLLLAYGALFGFSIGCFATLRSIVIVELLGLEKLTNAFGLLMLFQGIASIIGAPVAGALFDATGSYDASFYISGSLILISGLLCIPLRCLSRWEKNRVHVRKQVSVFVGIPEENEDEIDSVS